MFFLIENLKSMVNQLMFFGSVLTLCLHFLTSAIKIFVLLCLTYYLFFQICKYRVNMETINPSELPHSLGALPGYPHTIASRRIWIILICHLFICLILSFILSFAIYQKCHINRTSSWKRAMEIIGPIKIRLQNLEKERIIWKSYLEWIEDYCAVYYGLLSYLNLTATDLDKLCNNHTNILKTINDFSNHTAQSDMQSTSAFDSLYEERVASEMSWEGTTSDDDAQLISNFASVFANLKIPEVDRSEPKCHTNESSTALSVQSELNNDMTEGSGRDELDSLTQTSDENKFLETEKKKRKRQIYDKDDKVAVLKGIQKSVFKL